jgi:hypothetical protein
VVYRHQVAQILLPGVLPVRRRKVERITLRTLGSLCMLVVLAILGTVAIRALPRGNPTRVAAGAAPDVAATATAIARTNPRSSGELAIEYADMTAVAYGKAHPAPVPTEGGNGGPILGTAVPMAPLRAGIFEGGEPPFVNVVPKNRWQGFVRDEYVSVSAGYRPGDPAQGAVEVARWGATDRAPRGARVMVPAPLRSGALRVRAQQGSVLLLESERGVPFAFDLLTHQLTQQ